MVRRRTLLTSSLVIVCVTALAGSLAMVRQGYKVFLPSGWGLAPVGTPTAVGDMLAGGEASPDGRWIAFDSVGQGVHKAYLVDRTTGQLADKIDIQRGWIGLAWSPDSKTLYVSGGTSPQIHRLNVTAGKFDAQDPLKVPGGTKESGWLAGLAVDRDSAYIAASMSDRLVKLDLKTGEQTGELKFAAEDSPYQVRMSPTGHLFVSLQGAGKVAEVDPASMKSVRTLSTGRHPNDLLINKDRLFVACGNDDAVDIFDTYTGNREERIIVRPWPDAPPGSTPHALAATPDGSKVFVANSDNNAVAVLDTERRGRTSIAGFIPTGAYPCALASLADGKHLLIGSGKGMGTGPNDKTDKIDPDGGQGYPYIVNLLNGIIYDVDLSDPDRLKGMTKTVLAVSKYKPKIVERPVGAPADGTNPIPSVLGEKSPIKHVLYIIKENRTYDQVLGDLKKDGKPYGNGDPRLTLFGEDVSPNHHALAREYVLLDNLFASGEVSVDGHHWSNGAYVTDFMQRTWPQQYSGKGTPRLTESLAETPRGRIWDQVRRAGLSYRSYYYHTADHASAEWTAARKGGVRDFESVDIFIKEFKEFERKGTTPNFMVMALSEDHTSGTRPGAFTPKASVASNDVGIGKIVDAVSHSSLWKDFAIFIIEDDAQNGADHVDAHRTVGLVVSPYTRNSGVDSTYYTTTSMLRTMELIFGAAPMSQYDAAATPMYRAFRMKPDLTPYDLRPARIDYTAKNAPRKEERLLAAIDFSEPDQLTLAQEIELNKAIWASVRGREPYPGTVRRFGFGGPEHEEDEDE